MLHLEHLSKPTLRIDRALFEKYGNKLKYVYKICQNKSKWLVIMEKLSDTITNEERKDIVDAEYAQYRANKLKVIRIVNINNPTKKIKKIIHKSCNDVPDTLYEKGKIVYPDKYNPDLDNIHSNGIHYFKNIVAAYSYLMPEEENYTGSWINYCENGRKQQEYHCINGLSHGKFIAHHDNGVVEVTGYHENDKRVGVWTWYDEDGNKTREINYD